ncbi:MAG: stress response translation initiation inhibitor YciH [Candidatus Helarchaeota archaeon]
MCPKCSLPKELCVCGDIEKEENQIKIRIVKRKYGRTVTLIEGLETNVMKDVINKLKTKCACGGTKKKNRLELQGDHRHVAKDFLIKTGFSEDRILVQ